MSFHFDSSFHSKGPCSQDVSLLGLLCLGDKEESEIFGRKKFWGWDKLEVRKEMKKTRVRSIVNSAVSINLHCVTLAVQQRIC